MGETRWGIYCRISQDRKGKGLGVARQERAGRKQVKAKGGTVVRVYVDNDTSAYAKVREEFQQMTEDIKAGNLDGVAFWDQDRLLRKMTELEDFIDLVDKYGTELAQETGHIDLTTPQGRANARIRGTFAKMEGEQMALRIKEKNRELRAAGKPTTGARSFGYEKGNLVLRESEAELIRDATKRVTEGTSLTAIAKEWNAAGVRTVHGKDWRIQSLRVTLTRWRNAGIGQENGEPIEGVEAAWPAIVSREELTAVRAVLNDPARRTNKGGTARKHELSFLLTCDSSDAPMRWGKTTTRAGVEYDFYQCTAKDCWQAVDKDAAEQVVHDHIAARLAFPDAELTAITSGEREDVAKLRRQRAELDCDEREIEASKVSTASKLRMLEGIQEQREQVDAQIDRLTQRNAVSALMLDLTPVVTKKQADIQAAAKARQEVRAKFEVLDLDRRRAVIKALCTVRVLPHPKGVRPGPDTAKQRVIVTAVHLA